MIKQSLFLFGALASCVFSVAAFAVAAEGDLQVSYVTGVRNSEDLVAIPGTTWIIASGLADGPRAGSLFLINRREKTAAVLLPGTWLRKEDRASFPDCPTGPPTAELFSAHGLALRKGAHYKHLLYVVNHGGREAIEAFELDVSRGAPTLAWLGCVPLPEGVTANGIAPLPSGSIVVTHMVVPQYFATPEDAKSPQKYIAKLEAGEVTGYAAQWSAGQFGWRVTPGTEASGPNGIETSHDGKWIWIANWPSNEVVRVAAHSGKGALRKIVIRLDFSPDNLRWGDDGWLWAAGATGPLSDYFACASKTDCRSDYRIVRINPVTFMVKELVHPDTLPEFGNATTALKLGKEVWLGAYPGVRLAIIRVGSDAGHH